MTQHRDWALFVSEFGARLRSRWPNRSFKSDPDAHTIELDGGAQLNLANVFNEWKLRDEGACDCVLQNLVSTLTWHESSAIPVDFAEAKEHLMPRVRDVNTKGIRQLMYEVEGSAEQPLIERPLGQHLSMVVVFDGPGFMADVALAYAQRWSCEAEHICSVALTNLARVEPRFDRVAPGVYRAAVGDNYDASRMLLLNSVKSLHVEGRPIAFAASRDFLAITGEEDTAGLSLILDDLEHEGERTYSISVQPLRLEGDSWSSYSLPRSTDAGRRLAALLAQERTGIYEEQHPLLETWARAQDDETVVARCGLMDDPVDGSACTYTPWVAGISSLIPTTDHVGFIRDPAPWASGLVSKLFPRRYRASMWLARFEDALRVVGHRMTRLEMTPERHRVDSFPTQAELEAMGAQKLAR